MVTVRQAVGHSHSYYLRMLFHFHTYFLTLRKSWLDQRELYLEFFSRLCNLTDVVLAVSLVVIRCPQMTKQAGSWVPRLERMVQSRNLSDFEKSVLLTLIGSVIQPNKVHSWARLKVTDTQGLQTQCKWQYRPVYSPLQVSRDTVHAIATNSLEPAWLVVLYTL